jgi:drug/metabolite transporter (DMT)-like permease
MAGFAFVALGVVWGSNFLFMKQALHLLAPLQVAWMRVLFGAIPILLYALARGETRRSDLRHLPHFAAMGILANVIPFYGFVKGTQYLKSGVAGVISGTIPLMTVLIALLLLPGERVSRRKAAGLILGFAGVALVSHISSGMGNEALGVAFMLLGAGSYALANVYTGRYIGPLGLSPVALSAYQTLCASLVLALFTPTAGLGALTRDPWILAAVVLGLGLFGTGLAFVMYYYVIDKLGVATASSVFYLPPIVALFIGVVFLCEGCSASQLAGTALILAGIGFARG